MAFPFGGFHPWTVQERRSFALLLMIGVAIMLVVIAVDLYPRFRLQKELLAEVNDIASKGLSAARFYSELDPERRQLCFAVQDETTLRFLTRKLSKVEAERSPDHTLTMMRFIIAFSISKSEERKFDAFVYSEAPKDVFLRYDGDDEGSGESRANGRGFAVRVPGLSGWIKERFEAYGCKLSYHEGRNPNQFHRLLIRHAKYVD